MEGKDVSEKAFDAILSQQRAWAQQNGIRIGQDGYTLELEDNLFLPLSPNTVAQFGGGAGDEFGQDTSQRRTRSLLD